jgi:hypothetical protein
MLNFLLHKKIATDRSGLGFSRQIVPFTIGAMANVYDTELDTTPAFTIFGTSAAKAVAGELRITNPTVTASRATTDIGYAGYVTEEMNNQKLAILLPPEYTTGEEGVQNE